MSGSSLDRGSLKEGAKWVLATLAVIALFITAPIWGIPALLWIILKDPIKDMKKVIDGEMDFW